MTPAGPRASGPLLSGLGHDAKDFAARKARTILHDGFNRSICR